MALGLLDKLKSSRASREADCTLNYQEMLARMVSGVKMQKGDVERLSTLVDELGISLADAEGDVANIRRIYFLERELLNYDVDSLYATIKRAKATREELKTNLATIRAEIVQAGTDIRMHGITQSEIGRLRQHPRIAGVVGMEGKQ